MSCQYHPGTEPTWSEKENGKSTFGCPDCRALIKAQNQKRNEAPLIRYSPIFHRERPLSAMEKRYPPKKGS